MTQTVDESRDLLGDSSVETRQSSMLIAFWECRHYLLPQLRHFVTLLALTLFALVMNTGIAMFSADLLTNKVFLGEPLNSLQATLLGLSHVDYVNVETLSEAARFHLRSIFSSY